jgi:hypothetical protein
MSITVKVRLSCSGAMRGFMAVKWESSKNPLYRGDSKASVRKPTPFGFVHYRPSPAHPYRPSLNFWQLFSIKLLAKNR